MRMISAVVVLCALSGGALADTSCKGMATEKKLTGPDLTAFMDTCAKDASASCETEGKAKKLAGAALETQINTCMTAKIGLADNSKAPAGTKPGDAVKPAADAGKAPATTGTLPAAKPAAPAAAK